MSIRYDNAVPSVDTPSQVDVLFDTFEEFQRTRVDDAALAIHLQTLYSVVVGLIMPIRVTISFPNPLTHEHATAQALDLAKAMTRDHGSTTATTVLTAVLSHPEINGHPLPAEMLPMLSADPISKRVARLFSARADLQKKSQISIDLPSGRPKDK